MDSTGDAKQSEVAQVRPEIFEPINRLLARFTPGMNADQGLGLSSQLETEIKLAKAKAKSDDENDALEVVAKLQKIINGLSILDASRKLVERSYASLEDLSQLNQSLVNFQTKFSVQLMNYEQFVASTVQDLQQDPTMQRIGGNFTRAQRSEEHWQGLYKGYKAKIEENQKMVRDLQYAIQEHKAVTMAYNKGYGMFASPEANPKDLGVAASWALLENLKVKSMPMQGMPYRATDATVGKNDLALQYRVLSEAFSKTIYSSKN